MASIWTTTVVIVTTPNRAISGIQLETTQWIAAKPKFTRLSCRAMEVEQVATECTVTKVAMECITGDGEGQRVVFVMKIV